MGCLEGRVAFVTGAGRGQGRSHAIRMAEEGADIIAVDVPEEIAWLGYETANESDLAFTAEHVRSLGRRIVARSADVRDGPRLRAVVEHGVSELGRVDIVVTGVWRTVSAAVPAMLAGDDGGSVILIGSAAALAGGSNIAAYVAAK